MSYRPLPFKCRTLLYGALARFRRDTAPEPVISTEHEGAKRRRGSGEIPTTLASPCRSREFYPGSVPESAFLVPSFPPGSCHRGFNFSIKPSIKAIFLFRRHRFNCLGQTPRISVGGRRSLGISPLLLSHSAPSDSVEMTGPEGRFRKLCFDWSPFQRADSKQRPRPHSIC